MGGASYGKAVLGHAKDASIDALAQRHGRERSALLPILQDRYRDEGRLTPNAIGDIASVLGLSDAQVQGVASFYTLLGPARDGPTIRLCDGPCCWLHGASDVRSAIEAWLGPCCLVVRSSCLGLCDIAPAALVDGEPCGPLHPDRIESLATTGACRLPDYRIARPGETRILLAAEEDGSEAGAFEAVRRALAMTAEEVIGWVEAAGLRGRGGAGFPTGRKWRLVAQQPSSPKYVICNADESEPLAFKDRVLLDTNPNAVLAGMTIAGRAVGAAEGIVYLRGEYQVQARRLEAAIARAEESGWLRANIGGSGFPFRIHVHRGAGAYICGEETALIESLEGRRGEPRLRPPYPTKSGLRGQPTLVNNVETLATIGPILANGPDWYRRIGDPKTPGTKLYTVLGHVQQPGLFEAPYGLTLRRLLDEFGGGMLAGAPFQFALTGGAAGTFAGPELLDVPIDYESGARGVSLGSGAFFFCDDSVRPAVLLRQVLHFFEHESCGKCTPCRMGIARARRILDRIGGNPLSGERIESLARLADVLARTSFCGLGTSAALPIRSALQLMGAK